MMGVTHRPMGSAWWLGGVLLANVAGAGIHPVAAGVGALVAPVFAAGRLSPDADVTWLKHLGHRQGTHRPRTAAALTVVTLVVWVVLWVVPWARGDVQVLQVVALTHWLVWSPVTGWWSHLVGDAMFGRIPVGRRTGRLLLAVLPRGLGRRLVRSGGGRQAYWVGLGLDTDGLLERGNWRLRSRTATGLHKTRRVLPFAPATAALSGLTVALMVLVAAQAAGVLGSVA